MSILRLLLAVALIAVLAAFVMGYLSNRNQEAVSVPDRTQTSDAAARARQGAAQIGEKAGEAVSTVGSTLEEAALTTKIKAKMALDDLVKAGAVVRPNLDGEFLVDAEGGLAGPVNHQGLCQRVPLHAGEPESDAQGAEEGPRKPSAIRP